MRETLDASITEMWAASTRPRITAGQAAKHLLLLAITFCTATIAGTLYPFGANAEPPFTKDPETVAEFLRLIFDLPAAYFQFVAATLTGILGDPGKLASGATFAASLLFIMIAHEMGHYLFCRKYRVDATLPVFIPTPPMIGPAGTFGAFIKIKSPMPSRRSVFDIGVSGPLAGFVAMLPVLVLGILTLKPIPPQQLEGVVESITLHDPLLFQLFGKLLGVDIIHAQMSPAYAAAWVGALVTALNLIPAGQLDGGHAVYAVFGGNAHKWIGRAAFAVMATLTVCGIAFYGSPSGLLVTIIIFIMLRVGHPEPYDLTPLDKKRTAIAILTLIIFTLCFLPFPITIN